MPARLGEPDHSYMPSTDKRTPTTVTTQMGRSLQREEYPKLDSWLTSIEGTATPQTQSGDDVQCDFCGRVVEPGEPITNYLSDRLVNEEYVEYDDSGSPFHFLRVYCNDCHRRSIRNPCHGYLELLIEAELDPDYRLRNLEIADYSLRSEGVPYDPQELWEATHGEVSWDEFHETAIQLHGTTIHLGPADLTDDLWYHEINPRDVYDADGSIRLTKEDKEDIRRRIDEFRSEQHP